MPQNQKQANSLSPAGAVAQSVGAKILIVGLNAATGIITARVLQPAGRGELAAMILWPVFLASALTLGIPSALTFQLRSNPGRRSQLMGTGFVLAAMTSVVAMLIGFVFLPSWIGQYPPEAIWLARIFLITTPLTSLLLVGRAGLESKGDFAASNKLLICSPAITLILLLILLAEHALTPFSAGVAYIAPGVVPIVWMWRDVMRAFAPSLGAFRNSAQLLFSYGIRSYGIDLCGTMGLYVDQALVVRMLLPKMMGIYVVALSLSRMLNAFHTSVIMVLFPKAVCQSSEAIRKMTSRAMRMSTLLTASAGIVIIALGPTVLTLLYGPEYRSANMVLRILVVEVILSGATLVLSQAFMAAGRPGIVTALQLFGLLLSIPLMLVLVPRYGILGAGTALLLSTTSRFIFVVLSYPLFLKMPIPDVLPKAEDFLYMARAVAQRLGWFGSEALRPAGEIKS